MNKVRSKEEWIEQLKRFKESGISLNRNCRDNNLGAYDVLPLMEMDKQGSVFKSG